MRRLALILLLAASAAMAAPPNETDMTQHREKAALWSGRGLSCDQVIANLRGWFGRMFSGEPAAGGMCDVYVITWEWRQETGRDELTHRALVATIPM